MTENRARDEAKTGSELRLPGQPLPRVTRHPSSLLVDFTEDLAHLFLQPEGRVALILLGLLHRLPILLFDFPEVGRPSSVDPRRRLPSDARAHRTLERSTRDHTDMRTAALIEGVQRVAEAKLARGLFP